MSYVPPNIEAAIRAMLGEIPGIAIVSMRPAFAEPSVSETEDAIAVEVDAWGPTLHVRRLEWMVPTMVPVKDAQGYALPAVDEMSEDEIIAFMPTALREWLDVQRVLSGLGAAEGLGAPLPDPKVMTARDIAHIHVDPRMAALLIHNVGAETALQDLINALENALGDDDGVHPDHMGSISGGCHHVSLQTGHVLLSTRVGFGTNSHCDGDTVVVSGLIPEIAVTALPGRPLSALVRTGCAELDDAVIGKASSYLNDQPSRNSVLIVLEPADVRLGDHPVLGPLVRKLC